MSQVMEKIAKSMSCYTSNTTLCMLYHEVIIANTVKKKVMREEVNKSIFDTKDIISAGNVILKELV